MFRRGLMLTSVSLCLSLLASGCGEDPEEAGTSDGETGETGMESGDGDGDGDPSGGDGDPSGGDGDPSGGDGDPSGGDGDPSGGDGDPSGGDGDPSGGDGDGDGDGDNPFEDGEPFDQLTPGEWSWQPVAGTECRNGDETGVWVRPAADGNTDKVALFFQGGGACFNGFTCFISIPADGGGAPGNGGVFDADNPANPMADYNFVFFPYCTGDVFMGTKTGDVPLHGTQKFFGRLNLELSMSRVVPTFPDATELVFTGQSAGGFGAAANYDFLAAGWPDQKPVLIDDSAPIFRDQYLTPCLQKAWRDLWGVDAALPEDCADCFNADGGGLYNYLGYLQTKYPDRSFGLISSTADTTIRSFFGFGENNCAGIDALIPPSMDAATYEAGLYDLRDSTLNSGNFGTYIINSDAHVWTGNVMYSTEVGGVVLADWMGELINGNITDVAP